MFEFFASDLHDLLVAQVVNKLTISALVSVVKYMLLEKTVMGE